MLVEAFLNTVRRAGRATAVVDGSRELSYRNLARLAMILRDEITRRTDCPRVGLMLPASGAFPACLFGTLWAGRTAVPLNFLLNPAELTDVISSAEIDLILTVKPLAETAAGASARVVCLEDLALKRRMALGLLRRLGAAPKVSPDDTAVILFTSGTTAEPKGVELTHQNLHSNCVDTIASLSLDDRYSFLNVLPPFHVFGLTATVLVPALLGGTVYAIPRFSPMGMVRTIEKHKVSVMMAVPSMYAAVLKTKSATAECFSSVRLAVSGGEPLSNTVRDAFSERFGVRLDQGYGLTETSPVVSICAPQAHRPGTVGRPIPNVEVRIVGESGGDVGAEEDGEIFLRGPGIMKGYYKRPDDTRAVIDPDGWFRTGDIGMIDTDGFLHITGRAKDMLIIGGENVFPREIEAVLETHEGVMQAAVIGVPDDLRGEAPVAFVIPREGSELSEQGVRQFAKESLAGFKAPRRVIIRGDLPTGPTGKILKRKLRELL